MMDPNVQYGYLVVYESEMDQAEAVMELVGALDEMEAVVDQTEVNEAPKWDRNVVATLPLAKC